MDSDGDSDSRSRKPTVASRSSAILYGSYADAFLAKAIEGDLLTTDFYDSDSFKQRARSYRSPLKASVLQTFLLFDELVIFEPTPTYDYTKLENTGRVKLITARDELTLVGKFLDWDPASRSYARMLKPAVLNYLASGNHSQYAQSSFRETLENALEQHGLTIRQFCSAFFDLTIDESSDLSPLYRSALECSLTWAKSISLSGDHERIASMHFRWVSMAIATLFSLLDTSSANNGILLQNQFPLDTLSADFHEDADPTNTVRESYRILRLSLNEAIGELPKLKTIEDVLRLKDERERDIVRLREVVGEVETALRAGKENALTVAAREIRMAANDLNRGTSSVMISKWSTYLCLPIAAVEMYMGLPPVASITTAAVGTACTMSDDQNAAKNGWIQIVR